MNKIIVRRDKFNDKDNGRYLINEENDKKL